MTRVRTWRSWASVTMAALGVLCISSASAATLNAWVDRTAIEDGDTVQLTLEVEGQNSERPDLKALQADFEVLGSSSMTQMRLINGRATSSTQLIFNLRPRRVGSLTIPALQSGDARSNPIEIRVSESRQSQGANPDLFLEVELSPQSPYVQAQLVYTVRLFHAVDLLSGKLSEPRNADLLMHRVGDDRRYAATRNGRRYQVFERRYVLFAQQSGPLTIEAPVFEGQVPDTRRGGQSRFGQMFGNDPFFGRDAINGLMGGTRTVRVRGESREILVKPRPGTAQGKDWVPAQSVELKGQWQPEENTMQVGEPVTLTLDMTALGLTGAQLPEVSVEQLDGFSVYPDRADVETQFTAEGDARGSRLQKIAFIPRQAGILTIPDIVLRWWNTQTDREEVARLPGITRSVEGAPVSTAGEQTPSLAQRPSTPATAVAQQPTSALEPDGAASRVDAQSTTRLWMWLSALLVVAWVVTIALWLRDRRRVDPARGTGAGGHDEVASSERNARRQIAAACTASDAAATRRALLAWGGIHWHEHPPRGLEQIAQRIGDPLLEQALLALDRALYADASQWSADELRSRLEQLPKTNTAATTGVTRATSTLPLHYAQRHGH